MDKKQVEEYLDNMAETWDINMVKVQSKIDTILDKAEVSKEKRGVLLMCVFLRMKITSLCKRNLCNN